MRKLRMRSLGAPATRVTPRSGPALALLTIAVAMAMTAVVAVPSVPAQEEPIIEPIIATGQPEDATAPAPPVEEGAAAAGAVPAPAVVEPAAAGAAPEIGAAAGEIDALVDTLSNRPPTEEPAAPVAPAPAATAGESGPIRLMPITAKTVIGGEEVTSEREEMLKLLFETSNNILGDTGQLGVAEPLTLEDALRETLKQQPEVKLAEQDVATAAARRRIAAGEFDVTFTGNVTVGETNTEKTPSQIQEVLDARAETRADIDEARQEQRDLRAAISAVNAGRVPELDSPNKLSVFDSLADQLQNQLLEDALAASDAADVLDGLDSQRRGEIIQGFKDDIKALDEQVELLQQRNRENPLNTVNTSYSTKYKLMLAKKFRNAVRAEFGLDYDRSGSKGIGSPTDNKGKVLFNLIIPLGKGSGQTSAFAPERAAIKDQEASEATLRHKVSERLLETILSYWDLVSAQQEINILNASENLNRTLIQITDERITAERATDMEMQLALARYQEILAQRTQAESRLISARQLLALNVGRSQDTLKPITDFPWATSRFAAPVPMTEIAMLDPKAESSLAITRRYDVLSNLKREESAGIRKAAAWRDRLPKADFTMESFYGVVDAGSQYERLYKLWGSNYVGPSATFKLDVEYAFGNNRAMGEFAQSVSALERTRIQSTDLRRQIIASVLFDIAELTTSLAEIKRFDLAYGSYARAHEFEVELFEGGSGRSNLMNVVQAEERLTNASRSLLTAIRRHVQSIARYNFDTGQLLTSGPGPIDINFDNIKTLPFDPAKQSTLEARAAAAAAAGTPVSLPLIAPGAPGTPSPATP